ncbi:MAG: hypothetical protein EXR77_18525 [Myxococcales bacterium]|nr:hypothetical protein [Myxococcales bacterium]
MTRSSMTQPQHDGRHRVARSQRATSVTIVCVSLALASLLTACGKNDNATKKEAPNFFRPDPPMPKLDMSDIITVEAEGVAAKTFADTWAGHVKELVASAAADMQRCRNEYLIPFQFNSMKRRDVQFVSMQDMDETCELGSKDKKTRGVRRWLDALTKEHLSRNATVDRFVILAMEQVETYHVFSYMTKKIGAPDIDVVVKIAEKSQARILEIAPLLDRAAADVALLSDGLQPDDDAGVISAPVAVEALKEQIVGGYASIVVDLASGYERMADKSWQIYDMPKLATLRAMIAVLDKRAQQDRVRVGKMNLDPKVLLEFNTFFAACDAAGKQVASGFDMYEKKPKEERPERDPNLKAVRAAQKPLLKALTAWGYAGAAK